MQFGIYLFKYLFRNVSIRENEFSFSLWIKTQDVDGGLGRGICFLQTLSRSHWVWHESQENVMCIRYNTIRYTPCCELLSMKFHQNTATPTQVVARAASCSRVGTEELWSLFPCWCLCLPKPVDFPLEVLFPGSDEKERGANLHHLVQKPVVKPISPCWCWDYVWLLAIQGEWNYPPLEQTFHLFFFFFFHFLGGVIHKVNDSGFYYYVRAL